MLTTDSRVEISKVVLGDYSLEKQVQIAPKEDIVLSRSTGVIEPSVFSNICFQVTLGRED